MAVNGLGFTLRHQSEEAWKRQPIHKPGGTCTAAERSRLSRHGRWRAQFLGCWLSTCPSPETSGRRDVITSKDDGQAGIPAERLDIRIPIPSFEAVI
jgi:hypothetical protein